MCAPRLASHSSPKARRCPPAALASGSSLDKPRLAAFANDAPSATNVCLDSQQTHAHPDSVPVMSPDLDGRVIAIAGAGGGLGPVVAKRLADAGASLSLADPSQ